MPTFPQQQRLTFTLPHEKEAAILEREIESLVRNMHQAAEDAYPNGLPMAEDKLPPEQRLDRYNRVTYEEDKPLLAIDGYVGKFKNGELPPLMSPFWQWAVLFPKEFEELRRDYLHVSKHVFNKEE